MQRRSVVSTGQGIKDVGIDSVLDVVNGAIREYRIESGRMGRPKKVVLALRNVIAVQRAIIGPAIEGSRTAAGIQASILGPTHPVAGFAASVVLGSDEFLGDHESVRSA